MTCCGCLIRRLEEVDGASFRVYVYDDRFVLGELVASGDRSRRVAREDFRTRVPVGIHRDARDQVAFRASVDAQGHFSKEVVGSALRVGLLYRRLRDTARGTGRRGSSFSFRSGDVDLWGEGLFVLC